MHQTRRGCDVWDLGSWAPLSTEQVTGQNTKISTTSRGSSRFNGLQEDKRIRRSCNFTLLSVLLLFPLYSRPQSSRASSSQSQEPRRDRLQWQAGVVTVLAATVSGFGRHSHVRFMLLVCDVSGGIAKHFAERRSEHSQAQ